MNSRLKETIFVAGVFIATLIAVFTWPFMREAAAQAPPIKRNYFTTNQDPTITNIATNTFTFAVTNLVVTNSDGSYFIFELGPDSCMVFGTTNGVAYRICVKGDGSEFFLGQIGPVLVNAARVRLMSNGVTQVASVPATGNSSNVAWQVIAPANEGGGVWFQVKTNSGWTGTGTNYMGDDGFFHALGTVTAVTFNNLTVTNLTVISNLFSAFQAFFNNVTVTNSIQYLTTNVVFSNAFVFNQQLITNIIQNFDGAVPRYLTNIDAQVNNFISMHGTNEVQAISTNSLTTGSNQTNTFTLTNLTKGASCSISFYGAAAPSTNYLKIAVPSGSSLRWLNATNGTSDFGVTSNKFGVASFWCDRETNVFACYRESQ